MNYNKIYAIASSALQLEKLRIDVVALNIANQYTLQTDKQSFSPLEVVAEGGPFSNFLAALNQDANLTPTFTLRETSATTNKIYQPTHPAADKFGYINYPGVNTLNEMTTLMRATNAYEADIKIINTARELYLQALSIGDVK